MLVYKGLRYFFMITEILHVILKYNKTLIINLHLVQCVFLILHWLKVIYRISLECTNLLPFIFHQNGLVFFLVHHLMVYDTICFFNLMFNYWCSMMTSLFNTSSYLIFTFELSYWDMIMKMWCNFIFILWTLM